MLRRRPDPVAHFDILGYVEHDRQLAVVTQPEAVTDHRYEVLFALAVGAGHPRTHRADDVFQPVIRVTPPLKILFLKHATQALTVAVDGQGFAGQNFDFITIFLLLRGEVNDLAGKTALGLWIWRDVFEGCGVGDGRQSGNYQPDGRIKR